MSPTDILTGHEIVVPGSISNLGPGFDALSVAIALYLRVRIVELRPDVPDTIEFEFVTGAPAGENRVDTAFRRARAAAGRAAPGLRVEVRSEIPARAGLGSSGAATVAGLLLYAAAVPDEPHAWLRLARAIEGHPDNAAAALLGGLTLSCEHEDGRVTARSCDWPEAIRLVTATPQVEIATEHARSVLPQAIPLRDAVFNLQHTLLLVEALRTADVAALRDALRDRWHQSVRAAFVPGLSEALALRHPALIGVCLSGSGPSVVAFAERGGEPAVLELLEDLYARLGLPCVVRTVRVHHGAPGSERPRAAHS